MNYKRVRDFGSLQKGAYLPFSFQLSMMFELSRNGDYETKPLRLRDSARNYFTQSRGGAEVFRAIATFRN